MARFSANLGFLWTELPLADAIRAAARAGFQAVEFHDPFRHPAETVRQVLVETGLPVVSINTVRGDVRRGDNGLAALVGREDEARAAIEQAIAYAKVIGAPNVHVMAGRASGTAAFETYCRNLAYAAACAAAHQIGVLIEPLNGRDAPDYFLSTTADAVRVLDEVGAANLKLMFDCYHVQITEGDLCRRLEALLPVIGHIQIAGVPDRGEPDQGEIDFGYVLRHLKGLGHDGPIGAEYRPRRRLDEGLGWLAKFASI